MALRVVGAGLGRTGTHSLKVALEQLLGGSCYHMVEVFGHPEHVDQWRRAALDEPVDWDDLLRDYVATVDWPAASFWPELSRANPDALVLLSVRDNAQAWWKSASNTIFQILQLQEGAPGDEWRAMWDAIAANRFTADLDDEAAAIAAYERHNDAVRASVPADRLLEWRPADGWEPICRALQLPVPDEPFPHVNTTEEFRAMVGLDGAAATSDGPG